MYLHNMNLQREPLGPRLSELVGGRHCIVTCRCRKGTCKQQWTLRRRTMIRRGDAGIRIRSCDSQFGCGLSAALSVGCTPLQNRTARPAWMGNNMLLLGWCFSMYNMCQGLCCAKHAGKCGFPAPGRSNPDSQEKRPAGGHSHGSRDLRYQGRRSERPHCLRSPCNKPLAMSG